MKKLILVLTLISTLSVYSQTWAPVGAKWTYNASWVFVHAPIPVIDIAVWQATDTVSYLGKVCTRIDRVGPYVDGDYRSFFYTYEEDEVIYLYNDSTNAFTTLFDFNKTVGQTWILELFNCQIEMKVKNSSFDTINGVPYVSFDIEYDSVGGAKSSEMHANRLLGGTNRPLPFYDFICSGSIPDGKFYQGLRCYEDSIIGPITDTSVDCEYTSVGIETMIQADKISIYPNPGDGNITVNFKDLNGKNKIVIRNTLGVVVKEIQMKDHSQDVRIEGITGLYFIETYNNDIKLATFKYLKE